MHSTSPPRIPRERSASLGWLLFAWLLGMAAIVGWVIAALEVARWFGLV